MDVKILVVLYHGFCNSFTVTPTPNELNKLKKVSQWEVTELYREREKSIAAVCALLLMALMFLGDGDVCFIRVIIQGG